MDLVQGRSARQRNDLVLRLGCWMVTLSMVFSLVIQPPKAKAIVAEASLATSVIWAFMQSAGITFNGTGMNSSSWAEGIEPYLREFTEATDSAAKSFWHWLGYDGAADFIKALSWSKITHPSTMPFPSVTIPPAVAKKLARFTVWFAQKVGLASGGESKPVYNGATHLTGVDGYSVTADKSFSDCYNYNFGSNKLSIVQKTPRISLQYVSLQFYTPTFVAPDTGKYKISFVGGTSENSLGDNPQYGLGLWKVGVYKTDSADSNSFAYRGVLCDNEAYIGGFYGARPGSCSGSLELNFVKGEKYKFEIKVGAQDAFSSATFFWDFSLAKSDGVSSEGFATQPGALTPTYDDTEEKATIITIPGLDTEIAGINELLQAILDKLAANELTTSATIAQQPTPEQPDEEAPDLDGLGLPALGAALMTRFPFSIPWDVVRGIKLLAAPAEAPYWEVDFLAPIAGRVGGWKGSTKVVIDMGQYEIIGQLCRWTSTIGFCLILAGGTKKLIWTA